MANYQTQDDPYSAKIQDLEPQTPPQDVVIANAIAAAMMQLNVWRPAQVTAVRTNQKVDIQTQLLARYVGQTNFFIPPQIQNVMVWMPQGLKYKEKYPISVGDTGLALFCDRSLDVWSHGDGGVVNPNDSRAHSYNDAIFIPGLNPFSKQYSDGTDDLVYANGDDSAQLRLKQNGNILVGGKDADSPAVLGDVMVEGMDSLISSLNNLIDAITINAANFILVTGAPGGPSPLNPAIAVVLTNVKVALAALQSQYFDTAATNILSQQTFVKRGGA